MSERVVKISITAQVNSYLAGMDLVAKKTREGRSEAEQLTAKLEAQRKAIQFTGAAMVTAGGLIAAGLALAVNKAAEFDQAMSAVQAATHESEENMRRLKDAAIEAGARTVYSAKEAANAIEELAKAGLSADDILNGGLNGALDLAAAGGLDVAEAAGIAAVTLKQFGLTGDKAAHVADLLAAGAGKAVGDVTDMGMALKQSGLVANQFGLSVEETTGALAAFAAKGLLGSDAGTSFKTMLQRLVPQSKQAQEWMDALGLSAFDSAGNFIGLAEYAGKLETALGDMSQEQQNTTLSVLFGSDAVRGATVLLEEGQKGIQGWIDKVDDQGYAAETAAIRLDNLKGDIEQLGGAFDSLLISLGESGQGPLRTIVQGLTDLINAFNGMPDGAKQAVFWVGAVGSAVLLAGGTFLLAVPKIAAYRAAITLLGPAAQRASAALGTLAKGVGLLSVAAAAIAAIDPLKDWISDVSGYSEAVSKAVGGTKTLAESIEGLGTRGDVLNVKNLSSALEGLTKLNGNWFARFTSDVDKSVAAGVKLQDLLGDLGGELGDLATSNLPAAQAQFRAWAEATDGSKEQLTALLNSMSPYRDALDATLKSQGIAVDDTSRLGLAMGEAESATKSNEKALRSLSGQAEDTGDDIDKLSDQITDFGSAQVDLEEASSNFQDAIDSATESLKENGKNLDINEKKGRLNLAALRDIADATKEKAAATLAATGSEAEAAKVIEQGRAALIKARIAMGDSREEAEAYADKLGLIPKNISTAATLNTAQADEEMKEFRKKWKDFKINVKVGGGGGRMESRASGGILPGAPSNRDNMIAAVASGEYIVRASQTAIPENRRVLEYINAGGRMRGFADGGFVQPSYASRGGGTVTVAAPSLDGMRITGTLDLGNGLAGFVDGRIMQADAVTSQALRRGNRGR